MSQDACATLVLGVQFTANDLCFEQDNNTKECKDHGTFDIGFDYCPKCGSKLMISKNITWSKGFSSLAHKWNTYEKELLRNLNQKDYMGFGIWQNGNCFVFGITLGYASHYYHKDKSIITFETFETRKAELETILTILGFYNKPMEMHVLAEIY